MGCGKSAAVAPGGARPHHSDYQLAVSHNLEGNEFTNSLNPKTSRSSWRFPVRSLGWPSLRTPRLRNPENTLESSATVSDSNATAPSSDCFCCTGDYFRALDALRGFAAMCVLWCHLIGMLYGWNYDKGQYLAVDFFQVLSGFILAHHYMPPRKPHVTTPHIIGYRIARLFPLHWLTAIMTWYCRYFVTKTPGCEPRLEIISRAQEFLFLQSVGLPLPYCNNNNPSWSLSCEFWISVAFAFVIRLPMGGNIGKIFLGILGAMGQFALYSAGQGLTMRRNGGLMRCGSSFVLGMLSNSFYKNMPQRADTVFKAFPTAIEFTLCFLVYNIVWNRPYTESSTDYFGPPVFVVVVTCFAFEAGFLSKALRIGEIFGTVSYSMYLSHWSIIEWMMKNDLFASVKYDYYWSFFRLCYVVFPFSCVTYFLWEKPTNYALRKLVDCVLAKTD